MNKHIGYIGLGKMGSSMVARLQEKKWYVETYDISGKGSVATIQELVVALEKPRVVWVMVPSGKPVDSVVRELTKYVEKGDTVIDGGNSLYEDSMRRAKELRTRGIHFLDIGVSGGPETVRTGKPALMVGGEKSVFQKVEPLLLDLTQSESIGYMGQSGAGHFVKMVHNGIEYGMMQSLAEGFAVMKQAPFRLDVQEVARVYSNGSVIESRLTRWMESGFAEYGDTLRGVLGSVGHTGEGAWTVKAAKKFGIAVPVIAASVRFRVQSATSPSYAGKVLSMLRNQFGGHAVK
jgi:6-phosphogluconate dehydrogenase